MFLKTRLRLLILATLLPIVVVGVLSTRLLVEREMQALQSATWQQTRALVHALDSELMASIAALQVLAEAPALRAGDLEGFRADAERALRARGDHWLNIFVSDPQTGAMLLNLRAPAGAPLQQPLDPASVLKAAHTGQPTVSCLAYGQLLKRRLFAVRVPVRGPDGSVARVLSAAIDGAAIERLVDEQRYAPGVAAAVLDGELQFVVRRPMGKEEERASDSLRQAASRPAAAWTHGTMADGREVYRTVQRSAVADWTVSVAVARDMVEKSQRYVRALWAAFGGVLAFSLWLAWWLAQGIARPITALADAAPDLGRGAELTRPAEPASIEEVRRLHAALTEASARIRERDAANEAAMRALRAIDRAKDEFLAMLGHELRNPLSSLANASALLAQASSRPELVGKVAGILARQVPQMTRLVDDLLQVGRVTAGKIELVRSDVDLAAAARQALAAFEANGRLSRHAVRLQADEPVWVRADAARLEQIIANLLDNALKYTPAGGDVALEVGRAGPHAVLRVSDSGQGMAPELLARAFDLFAQGERDIARQQGGLGIGLTLAQKLAQLHGGQITAHSAGAGQGSTFIVRLPAVAAPQQAMPAEARPWPGGRRVLVIEDNPDGGASLCELLQALGHEAEVAASGAAGLARAAAIPPPDLVLVDIGLPDIDGYEVARRLRASAATRGLRLVALTGYGAPEDVGRALAAGFDRHIAKPIPVQALEDLLSAPA